MTAAPHFARLALIGVGYVVLRLVLGALDLPARVREFRARRRRDTARSALLAMPRVEGAAVRLLKRLPWRAEPVRIEPAAPAEAGARAAALQLRATHVVYGGTAYRVGPAAWGESTTFGRVNSGFFGSAGSFSNTSRPAAQMRFSFSAR